MAYREILPSDWLVKKIMETDLFGELLSRRQAEKLASAIWKGIRKRRPKDRTHREQNKLNHGDDVENAMKKAGYNIGLADYDKAIGLEEVK